MPLINSNHLFIHIPKNAGRSIEEFFSIKKSEELIKPKNRNLLNLFAKFLLNITSKKNNKKKLWGTIDYALCSQHLTLQEIELLQLINKQDIKKIKKFAVVRNPYSRAVSTYKHFKNEEESFEDFIDRFFNNNFLYDHNKIAHQRSQLEYLVDVNGNFCINDILRFENISSDFSNFCLKHGYENSINLKHIGKNSKNQSYREYYNSKTKKIIADIFSNDLQFFNYKF